MSRLFTVLIAEKEHIDAIRQENKLFFEPFLENKNLAFCYWNPQGQSLYEAVPGLLDAVSWRKEWRAVIIDSCTDDSLKAQNPFDRVDCSAIADLEAPSSKPESDEALEDWENEWKEYYEALAKGNEVTYRKALELPLQKLATWLCFRPEGYILNDVREKQDVHDWAMEQIGRDDHKPSVRLENLEREHYKRNLRLKEQLRKEFVGDKYLNIAYPTEIHCTTLRTADGGFFNPDDFWNVRQDNDYSAFADRNMFFDKMRFMVFDLLPGSHRNFRNDYIRFLATMLVFASNPAPSSAMQARRLYSLETETDDTPLRTLVTSYDKKLAATAQVVENEMEKIRSEIPGELSDKAAEALFCKSTDVAVVLDESCDPEKVLTAKDYGLSYDCPEDELDKWNRDRLASEKALSYIVKQQARAVRKSVNKLGAYSEISDTDICRLTPFQIDDIREFTDNAEDEMVESIPKDFSDLSPFTERLDEEAKNIKKVIKQRMTRKTTAILSLVCLGLYLVCFLPFLFANNGTTKSVTTAIILIAVVLGVLALAMFVSLLFMRLSVTKAIKAYNNTARDILKEIQQSMKQFSRYLSASCNVRKGHTVLNYSRSNLDEYTKSLRIRKKHLEDISKKRAILFENYKDYFGDRSYYDETMIRPYDYDFDQTTEYAYPAPFLAGDFRQIDFMSKGNMVSVPSSYITRIIVRMEGIYEK